MSAGRLAPKESLGDKFSYTFSEVCAKVTSYLQRSFMPPADKCNFAQIISIHPGDILDPRYANNIMFFSLIGAQLVHVFNMDESRHFFRGEEFRNRNVWWSFVINGLVIAAAYLIPQVREALYLGPLTWPDIAVIAGAMLVSFVVNRVLGLTLKRPLDLQASELGQ